MDKINYIIKKEGNFGVISPIPTGHLAKILIKNLSYKNKFYPNMPEWAKVTYLYKPKTGKFMWGLIYRVKKIFDTYINTNLAISYKIVHNFKVMPQKKVYDQNLRPYQQKAVDLFLEYNIGIIQLPCGAGKTRTALEIINQLELKTIVIVHTKELKQQWEEYNSQNLFDIYTYQYMVRHLDLLKDYNFIMH